MSELSEQEREALETALIDDRDRREGYSVLGPGGTDGNTPTVFEVVARIKADAARAALEEAAAVADRLSDTAAMQWARDRAARLGGGERG